MVLGHPKNSKKAKNFCPCQNAWAAQADVERHFVANALSPLFIVHGLFAGKKFKFALNSEDCH